MKKLLLILTFFVLTFFVKAQTIPIAQTIPNLIPYTLPADEAHVSKGIYDLSGHLLRTLESNVSESAGIHTVAFDGLDDDGNPLTIGANYQLKVAYNNDTMVWGTIGNTSTYMTGTTSWGGGSQICSMFMNGTSMYCATGFSEGKAGQRLFNTATPQQCSMYSAQILQTGQGTYFNAGSNKFLLNAGSDYNGTKWFIFPERLSNNKEVTFSGSVLYAPHPGRSYHAIDTTAAPITSLACQQNGYSFVGHGSLNSIDVIKISDSSGTKIRTLSLSGVTSMTVDKDNDNVLWVSFGTTISKYTINSDGTITSLGATITGLTNVINIDVKGGEIVALDGGNQQIAKFYNSTTLAPTHTIGTAGGYSTSPTVNNNKFYWDDLRGSLYTPVTHDASGGVWIGDPGNCRVQHYNSSGTFIETIMYIGTYVTYKTGTNSGVSYCVNIGGNQNTSIFSDLLEFQVDYTQPLNTAWTLVNNWGYNLPTAWHTNAVFGAVYKYPNGRRFAITTKIGSSFTYLAELTNTGLNIIMTRIPDFAAFDAVGNLTTITATNTTNTVRPVASAPGVLTYQKYLVTVPNSGNPTIGTASTIATINAGYQYPLTGDRHLNVSGGIITVFDTNLLGARDGSSNKSYAYAAYDSTTCTRLWKAGYRTSTTYKGDLPTDGTYDVGNTVQYGGNTLVSVGNGSYAGYHGEFWKQSETGIIYRWTNIGLLACMFGKVGPETVSGTAPYQYASNTLKMNATQSNGYDWIFNNDESQHSAVSWWKINTSSEGVTSTTFPLDNRTYIYQNNITDYLANVPGGQVSISGLAGTAQVPSADNPNFLSITATKNYLPGSHDVTLKANTATGDRYWKFFVNPPTQWTFWGEADFTINSFVSIEGSTALNYIALTDAGGKDIMRWYLYRTNRFNLNGSWFGPFTNPKYKASQFTIQRVNGGNTIYFSINLWGTTMSTTVPMYDVTADIAHPAYFSVHTVNTNQGVQISINKLKGL